MWFWLLRVRVPSATRVRKSQIPNLKPVPVAQPDRASDFGSEGWGFESLQARHLLQGTYADFAAIKKKCVCHLLATFKAKGRVGTRRRAGADASTMPRAYVRSFGKAGRLPFFIEDAKARRLNAATRSYDEFRKKQSIAECASVAREEFIERMNADREPRTRKRPAFRVRPPKNSAGLLHRAGSRPSTLPR